MAGKSIYTDSQRAKARDLWLDSPRLTAAEIARICGLNSTRVLYRWAKEDAWTQESPLETMQQAVSFRYNALLDMERPLTPQEREECEWLSNEMLKLGKVANVTESGSNGKGRTPGIKNGEGKPKKAKKNDVSHLTAEDFRQFREQHLFPHQLDWYNAGQEKYLDTETGKEMLRNVIRFILKSRKIGATWFFAFEAFEDAVLNGNNQAFISATRFQAEVFKGYISAIAKEFFGCELSGNPTVLKNGDKETTLYYLSTNHLSAQTVGGCVYFDEVFWTRGFARLYDVASPIASFIEHRITLISTPSAISHEAYPKWTGKEYNDGLPPEQQIHFSTKKKDLKNGRLCEDGIWRQVVTLEDAVERGFNRISVKQMKQRTAPDKYRNFYNCDFVDDANSYFKLSQILALAQDPLEVDGWKPNTPRPYGNRPTSVGYDPGGKVHFDAAALLSVPTKDTEPFNLLDFRLMRNMPTLDQFGVVKEWMDSYNVIHFEFDTTGPGQDMEKYALREFPNCTPVRYNPAYKTAMVNKMASLVSTGRFCYDAQHREVPLAFMTVYQTTTPQTGQITYASHETQEAGHGDLFWAIGHGVMCEELIPDTDPVESFSF